MGVLYKELKHQIVKGLKGENSVIPLSLDRLSQFVSIGSGLMYVVAGEAGAGKSSLSSDLFIVQPLLWLIKNKDKTNIKLDIIYFGLERKQFRQSAKWLSRLIYEGEGIYIPVERILGRGELMSPKEQELIGKYKPRFEELEPNLHCYDGLVSPTEIEAYIEDFAVKNGKLTEVKGEDGIITKKVYKPNEKNHIVLIITDHLGLVSTSGKKKQDMDDFSRVMRLARDTYGFSPVLIQQLNRALSDTTRIKMGNLAPRLSDLADTSASTQDADIIIALMDVFRYLQEGNDSLGYDVYQLRDNRGVKYYRSVHILKNSYGADGIGVGVAFYPFVGIFKSLPRPEEFTEQIAEDIKSGNYFKEFYKAPSGFRRIEQKESDEDEPEVNY